MSPLCFRSQLYILIVLPAGVSINFSLLRDDGELSPIEDKEFDESVMTKEEVIVISVCLL